MGEVTGACCQVQEETGGQLPPQTCDSHQVEERPNFAMKIVKKHDTAFRRQIGEAVRIRVRAREVGVNVLNSKLEYSRSELPKLVMEKGSRGGGPSSKAPKTARNVSSSSSVIPPVSNIVSENQENISTFNSLIEKPVGVVPEISCGSHAQTKPRSVKFKNKTSRSTSGVVHLVK